MRMLCAISALALAALLPAQEPPAGGRGGRGGPALREFLGLGPPPDAKAAERGAKLYSPNCGFCHGENANGASGPDLVRSPVVLHDEKGELIVPVLRDGRPDKGMPAFAAMTSAQLSDIAQFLHLRVELTANRGTYKTLNVVTGDPKRGEQYFNGAGGCAACHSPTGDLAKIAARYPPDQLQNRFLWPGGGRGAPRKVTVELPSGEKVSGTLARIDDFSVDLTDGSGARRSFNRDDGVKVDVEDRLTAHRTLLDKYSDADIHDLTAYLVTLK
ncbi:MAG TPA: cytochrome c [Verrucomicrobiae bacterium]|nr:cytochrome c [Verrucomicrobiae bacterium]